MRAPSLLHQLMALLQSLNHHGQNVEKFTWPRHTNKKNKYTTLLEVWRRRWNRGRTATQKVQMMVEQILQRGGCGEEFKTDFVLYSKEKQGLIVSYSKHWRTDAIEQKNKDKKKFLGECGRGKTIDRIDHQTIIYEAETYLQEELATLPGNRMLEIIEEDVRATLALAMGPLEVPLASADEPKNKYTKLLELWRRRWNLGRTGPPKVAMMVE
ncbi:hypothetical protein Cgig2_002771 [Carnegiea gigantea]|uniref:Uncharacterized protein n=1 Tax=Carnegiea gigantea TaxID=171969 RepID=A0A9Q1JP26_9CARY|nr:hypothetical protein Cgig2_002771 [Carnegiea gigantea]